MTIAIRDDIKRDIFRRHGKIRSRRKRQDEVLSSGSEVSTSTQDTYGSGEDRYSTFESKTGDSTANRINEDIFESYELQRHDSENYRYIEAECLMDVLSVNETPAKTIFVQLDDDTMKDVFLSSLVKEWRDSHDNSDLVFYMQTNLESLQNDIVSTVHRTLYKGIPVLRDMAFEVLRDENGTSLLVIDIPDCIDSPEQLLQTIRITENGFSHCIIMIISPFIQKAGLKDRINYNDRYVDIFRKESSDIVATARKLAGKDLTIQRILSEIANPTSSAMASAGFGCDPFFISLLISTSNRCNVDYSITQLFVRTVDNLVQIGVKKRRVNSGALQTFTSEYGYMYNQAMEMYTEDAEAFVQYTPMLFFLASFAYRKVFGQHESIYPAGEKHDKCMGAAFEFGISTGLLRRTDDEQQNANIEFTHWSFQSFFAALWTVQTKKHGRILFETLDEVLSHKLLLIFSAGLDPQFGRKLTEMIVGISIKDGRILQNRQSLDYSPFVENICSIYIAMTTEGMQVLRRLSEDKMVFAFPDILYSHVGVLEKLMFTTESNTLSLYNKDNKIYRSDEKELITDIIDKCPKLHKLSIDGSIVDILHERMGVLQSLQVLQVTGQFDYHYIEGFRRLTCLSLADLQLSKEEMRGVEIYIRSMINLKELCLKNIKTQMVSSADNRGISITTQKFLRSLTVRNACLTEINIKSVSILEELVLDNVQCNSEVQNQVFKCLNAAHNLRVLDARFDQDVETLDLSQSHQIERIALEKGRIMNLSPSSYNLKECILRHVALDVSGCASLAALLSIARRIETLKLQHISLPEGPEHLELNMNCCECLRTLKIERSPVSRVLLSSKSLTSVMIDSKALPDQSSNIQSKEDYITQDYVLREDEGFIEMKDQIFSMDISNGRSLKYLDLGLMNWKIRKLKFSTDRLEHLNMRFLSLDEDTCQQVENLLMKSTLLRECTLRLSENSYKIRSVNLLNNLCLNKVVIMNVPLQSVCPANITSLYLAGQDKRTQQTKPMNHHSPNTTTVFDFSNFVKLENVALSVFNIGDDGLSFGSSNASLRYIGLKSIRLTLTGWHAFLQSLQNVEQEVLVKAWNESVPDDIVKQLDDNLVFQIDEYPIDEEGNHLIFKKIFVAKRLSTQSLPVLLRVSTESL